MQIITSIDSSGRATMEQILAAIKSGYLKTNSDGGKISGLTNTYARLVLYPDASEIILQFLRNNVPYTVNLGDDSLSFLKNYSDSVKIAKIINDSFGMEIHPEKGENGCFFLQKRVDGTCTRGEWLTPSPRAFTKCF